jgi:hypothetical protein
MAIIEPITYTNEELYRLDRWTTDECYRYYVDIRRRLCTFRQILDLWLRAPLCDSCALSDPIYRMYPATLAPESWEHDLECLDGDASEIIRQRLREDAAFALTCKRCTALLRPWRRDQVWVVHYHLEEHYGIPTEAEARRAPKQMRKAILHLYDHQCFGCGSEDDLHIDHVLPQSRGGTAAFRNLQPLCRICGELKGDSEPEELTVVSDMYFEPPPSDGYEGMFW